MLVVMVSTNFSTFWCIICFEGVQVKKVTNIGCSTKQLWPLIPYLFYACFKVWKCLQTVLSMKSTSYHLVTIINLNVKVEADIKSRDSVCAACTLWTRWPQNPCIMVCKSTSFWSTDHHCVNDHRESIPGFVKHYTYQVFFRYLFFCIQH